MRASLLTSVLQTIRYPNIYVNPFPSTFFTGTSIPLLRTRFHGSRNFHAVKSPIPDSLSRHLPPESRRHDPHAWVEAANALLPPPSVLNSLEERSLGNDDLVSPSKLLAFLNYARRSHGVDVLFQLGVYHAKWNGVLWIARRILQLSYISPIEPLSLEHLQIPVRGSSLDELTSFAIRIASTHQKTTASMPTSDLLSGEWIPLDARRFQKLSIAETWRSLGSMILEAADESGRRSKDIMPHVLQIIAHLHHINALPSKIYSYTTPVEGATPYRPPTLHLLSSRMLTSLSDAAWKAHENLVAAETAAVGAQYTYLGHEAPGARYKVKVRELGPEVWMELVLWACVECGLVKEGASILQELKLRSQPDSKWHILPWNAVQPATSRKDPHTNWEQVNSRAGIAEGRIEGYNLESPSVELGARTISKEVVMAMIDGLLSNLNVIDPVDGRSSREILVMIVDLCILLSRDGYYLDTNASDRMVIRIADYLRPELRLDPGLLKSIVKLATMSGLSSNSSPDADNSSSESLSPVISRPSEAIFKVLYSLLHMYAELGDFRRANVVIRQLEAINNRTKPSTPRFIDTPEEEFKKDNRPKEIKDIKTRSSAIAAYVDLVTQLGELEGLFHSPFISQQLISENLYLDGSLIPALLRFSGATSDKTLLENLEYRITPPLPVETLRAYLHCHVQLRHWDIVASLLGSLRGDANASWDVELAMRLAGFMMSKEQIAAEEVPEQLTEKELNLEVTIAERILTQLLRGDHGPPEAERISSVSAQDKYVECIGRMLQDASDELAGIWVPSTLSWRYLRAADTVPVRAFNVLLQAVVLNQGSLAGARMWELWCQDIRPVAGRNRHDTFTREMVGLDLDITAYDGPVYGLSTGLKRATWSQRLKGNGNPISQSRHPPMALVTPNLATLQIIMRGAIAEREHLRIGRGRSPLYPLSELEEDDSPIESSATSSRPDMDALSALFVWGAKIFRAFGYSEKEIEKELRDIEERRTKPAL